MKVRKEWGKEEGGGGGGGVMHSGMVGRAGVA